MASAGGHWVKGLFVTPTNSRGEVADWEEQYAGNKQQEFGLVTDERGLEVMRLEGDRDSIYLSDSDLARTRGMVFSHNHPSGGSFSPEDIGIAANWDHREIRAAGINALGERTTYSMKRPKGGWPDGDVLESRYHELDAEYKRRWTPEVTSGRMDVDWANANHSHHIWKQISGEFGLSYRRIQESRIKTNSQALAEAKKRHVNVWGR